MRFFSLLLSLLVATALPAQFVPGEANRPPRATAARFADPIELDGKLDEPQWQASIPADNFWETFPTDTARARDQTEIYFGFDGQNLYIGAKCYTQGSDYVVPSLRRDYRAGGNDNLTLILNPFKDKTNAIVFGMNPYGVTREALIYNGGENGSDFREEWDNKWRGESYIGKGYYSMELIIPYTTLRFPGGDPQWYFNAYRFDTQSNTRSTWHRIPQNQIIMSLAYMGTLDFIGGTPAAQGSNFTVIPYAGGSYSRDFQSTLRKNEWDGNVGGDAKVGIGSGLNLDLTVNPDFSQVEVDEQVINTSRFEIFFPERRQFFLENADLFGSFGFSSTNPFFSRRIGVTRDTTTGEALQNPIYFGARLSGKANDDLRVGLLNMQAQDNFENGLPSYNYTVAALQHKVGARSNVGAIFVNKENFGSFSDTSEVNINFNRVAGLDYNLATPDNMWTGKTFLHRSFSEGQEGDDYVHGAVLEYNVRNWNVEYDHSYVGKDYNAEVGFVPRRNFFTTGLRARRIDYPGNQKVVEKGPRVEGRAFFQPGVGLTDRSLELGYGWNYFNTQELSFGAEYNYIFLFSEFDPTRSDATPLPADRGYGFTNFAARYRTDRRKRFSSSWELEAGEFFNGYRYGFGGGLVYRYQPFGSIDLRFNYQYINLPKPYASRGLFLIGPRIDLTFSKSVFLTTFLQYNEQISNVNVNARLQWRYAPVSDFFLVYTDNYDSFDLSVKNRAIVAKVTYWLNL